MKNDDQATPEELAEEQYKFHRLADHDLEHAELVLERIPNCEDKFLQHALIKDAVLSASKSSRRALQLTVTLRQPIRRSASRSLLRPASRTFTGFAYSFAR